MDERRAAPLACKPSGAQMCCVRSSCVSGEPTAGHGVHRSNERVMWSPLWSDSAKRGARGSPKAIGSTGHEVHRRFLRWALPASLPKSQSNLRWTWGPSLIFEIEPVPAHGCVRLFCRFAQGTFGQPNGTQWMVGRAHWISVPAGHGVHIAQFPASPSSGPSIARFRRDR
jgi:hypothetical protein